MTTADLPALEHLTPALIREIVRLSEGPGSEHSKSSGWRATTLNRSA
jgi:hypothetical protein